MIVPGDAWYSGDSGFCGFWGQTLFFVFGEGSPDTFPDTGSLAGNAACGKVSVPPATTPY